MSLVPFKIEMFKIIFKIVSYQQNVGFFGKIKVASFGLRINPQHTCTFPCEVLPAFLILLVVTVTPFRKV